MRTVVKNPADKQEVFDYVVTKLREQGCISMENDICMYRGPNNARCAAGHLIPDEDYLKEWERTSIYKYQGSMKLVRPVGQYLKAAGYDLEFVADLQYAHDGSSDMVSLEPKLEKLAWKYEIKYTPPSVV